MTTVFFRLGIVAVVGLLLALPCAVLGAQTYTAYPDLAVHDLLGQRNTINVTGGPTSIHALRLQVDIAHTWVEDLDLYLLPPGATFAQPLTPGVEPALLAAGAIELSSDNGGNGDNYYYTWFTGTADPIFSHIPGLAAVDASPAPFSGIFTPEDTAGFDALYGSDANGDWTLVVIDDAQQDTGTWYSWTLEFAADGPYLFLAEGSGLDLEPGVTLLLDAQPVGEASTMDFTIRNLGPDDLLLNGTPRVAVENRTNCQVTVTTSPEAATSPQAVTTFDLRITPSHAGTYAFDLSIASNDPNPDHEPYVISIEGEGVVPLSGTYSLALGGSGDFETFEEVRQQVMAQGIDGDVTISVQPGTFLGGFAEPLGWFLRADEDDLLIIEAADPEQVPVVDAEGGDPFVFAGTYGVILADLHITNWNQQGILARDDSHTLEFMNLVIDSPGDWTGPEAAAAVRIGDVSNLYLHHNTLQGGDYALIAGRSYLDGVYIYNNFLFGAGVNGAYFSTDSFVDDVHLLYNSIHLNSDTDACVKIIDAFAWSDSQVMNNIFSNGLLGPCLETDVVFRPSVVLDYNLYHYQVGGNAAQYAGVADQSLEDLQDRANREMGGAEGDPLFVDAVLGDLHIATGSAAFAHGTGVASPFAITSDTDGELRNPVNPCIGADEIGGGIPDIQLRKGTGENIAAGETTSVGGIPADKATNVLFAVENTGTLLLQLLANPQLVQISNRVNCSVSVAQNPASTVNPGAQATFSLAITPAGGGAFTFQVTIFSTDPDEGMYAFTVTGMGSSSDSDSGCCGVTPGSPAGAVVWLLLLGLILAPILAVRKLA